MGTKKSTSPSAITICLGDDYYWWLDETTTEAARAARDIGLLDPRQLADLGERFEQLRPHGFPLSQFTAAFSFFAIQMEPAEHRLRLIPTANDPFEKGARVFAQPRIDSEEEGPYDEFLDGLGAARVRLLNATHNYAQPCTEFEMQEELAARDSARYFSNERVHVYEEINEILRWSPAEWDDSLSA